jgi:coenzyme F420-dependent glucose-6-phosphate dehydrogenase
VARIGYHASHEQYAPGALLEYVQAAEAAGFDAAMCSDHFFPWSDQQGQSAFAFAWLGAALQATSLSFGSVCAPGQRYHPAIVAQAAATLAAMYPGRYWIALGSGQNLNEHITGDRWPVKAERNARLKESVDVMRALFAGEMVTHHGLVTVEDACLYTRPAEPPPIVGAAVTPETARWVGSWADALITIAGPRGEMREVDAFREGGGEASRCTCRCSYRSRDRARRHCGPRTRSGAPTSSRARCSPTCGCPPTTRPPWSSSGRRTSRTRCASPRAPPSTPSGRARRTA